MSDWIPVSYAIPDDNTNVIIEGGIGYIRKGIWMTVTGERFPGKEIQWVVTHWQPIPVLDSLQTMWETPEIFDGTRESLEQLTAVSEGQS